MPAPKDPEKYQDWIKRLSLATKGVPKSDSMRSKLAVTKTGIKRAPFSKVCRDRMRESHLGERNHQYGKPPSLDHRAKIVEGKIGGFWYGNVRYNDVPQYCEKYNENLRRRVRAYFGHRCFECGMPQLGINLSIHHVHYNKKTCCDGSPNDLVPLCLACHAATNTNRDYWEKHFTHMLYSGNPSGKCFFTREEMRQYPDRTGNPPKVSVSAGAVMRRA
jgi:hypothetical protein